MHHRIRLSAVIFILLFHRFSAGAQELVTNGGFEDRFAGWSGTFVWQENADFACQGRAFGVVDDLSSSSVHQPMIQSLFTTPGQQYYLRFALLSGAGRVGEQTPPGTSPVIVRWGGNSIGQFSENSTTTWRPFQLTVTASAFEMTLNFESTNAHWEFIDGISVTPIPEASTVGLLFAGAVAITLCRRRSSG